MKQLLNIFLILFPAIVTCCGEESDSPDFDDDDIVEISGSFVYDDGSALKNAPILLKNLRRYGYINPLETFFSQDLVRSMFVGAFWFVPLYNLKTPAPSSVRPNYYLEEIKTNSAGEFVFSLRAGDLLRDSAGAINLSLSNSAGSSSEPFGRYNFVIKDQITKLESLTLCRLSPFIVEESGSNMNISWTAPAFEVDSYEIRFGKASDNATLWISSVAATQTNLSLPKTIFGDENVRIAIEAFYKVDPGTKKLKKSCLTPSQIFTVAEPAVNLAANAPGSSDEIDFTLTSLTNSKLDDPWYLEAFATKSVTLDLGSDSRLSNVTLHNLLFSGELGRSVVISLAQESTPDDFTVLSNSTETTRFMNIALPSAVDGRYLKIETGGAEIKDLQEIKVQ